MNRDEVLKVLRAHKAILARLFGVANLALFGSVARNEMSEDGDIDILIRFDRPATSKAYFGVQFYVEDLLGSWSNWSQTRRCGWNYALT